METDSILTTVLNQAMYEYLSRRHCHADDSPEATAENVQAYVKTRYGCHAPDFQARKLGYLLPRIAAAQEFLRPL